MRVADWLLGAGLIMGALGCSDAFAGVTVSTLTATMQQWNNAAWWTPMEEKNGNLYTIGLEKMSGSSAAQCVVLRRDPGGNTSYASIATNLTDPVGLPEGHIQCSIIVDGDSIVHAFYAMHGGPIRYKRTTAAYSISSWVDGVSSFPGGSGGRFTYPICAATSDGNVWLLIRNQHSSTNAFTRMNLYKWTNSTNTWALWNTLCSGQSGDNEEAYVPYPQHMLAVGNDLHIVWDWAQNQPRGERHYASRLRFSGNKWFFPDNTSAALPRKAPASNATAGKEVFQLMEGVETWNTLGSLGAKIALSGNNTPVVVYKYARGSAGFEYNIRSAVWTSSGWDRATVQAGQTQTPGLWISQQNGLLRLYSWIPYGPLHLWTSSSGLSWTRTDLPLSGNYWGISGVRLNGQDWLYLADPGAEKLARAIVIP
jgi:BNR repeat-containing family member